ncbi:SpaA isopeptide-forming pilin-related protein [Citricoccus muralis]|uniref:SpaA isopeptide-forming pilin-related protein n=1 Tax=Citricoccus muralis TaxID=169134 RepID=A0ABY8H493_9MICC|nr:SpaA isopeptide-forming pilin-related protein [Citricoccus muralis]WFP15952.1 SpaA isopeptide-forming pilin-related protein [Citricoccus muralis]
MRQITPEGQISDLGSWTANPPQGINGLAIGADGATMYAHGRAGNAAQNVSSILEYRRDTGVWRTVPNTSFTTGANRSLVAGAVNLANGRYLFGAYHQTPSGGGNQGQLWFYVYEYNPATETTRTVGYINTGLPGNTTANGDIAFDANGNLYVVRSGTTTSIYSVTAAELARGTGSNNQLQHSATESRSGILSNVNGIAFDADGLVYLGNGTTVRKYNPTTWQQVGGNVTTSLSNSTDLANCNSPANLTVKKNVDSRVQSTDQFSLNVHSGATLVSTATTTGTANGIQPIQVGPVPVVAGQTYRISETAAGTTQLSSYGASYVCREGERVIASGEGISGTVQIPALVGGQPGASVECIFTNTPLEAEVSVQKIVQDASGENPQPASGWTVNAAPQSGATRAPNNQQQTAGSEGRADWKLQFTSSSAVNLTVSETMQDDYEFVSATCEVVDAAGAERTVTLSSESGTVSGVRPGDSVDCTFVNKLKSSFLTLVKEIQEPIFDPDADASQWELSAQGANAALAGITDSAAVTKVQVPHGSYTLSEELRSDLSAKSAGYQQADLTCVDVSDPDGTDLEIRDDSVAVGIGSDIVCTFVNETLPGSISWAKVAEGSGEPLNGSEWTMVGPSHPDGFDVTGNEDGEFSVENLIWGNYTVTETRAPVGYVRDAEFTAEVGPASLHHEAGDIVNPQQDPLIIPLTGGFGSHLYWIGGGILAFLALAIAFWKFRRGAAHTG